MTKYELETKTNNVLNETQSALQTVFDTLNKGQQNKLLKGNNIKILFDRYNVIY